MSHTVYKLMCSRCELQLKGTLNGGQSFRWKRITKDDIEEWIGVFYGKVWFLQQHDDYISYKVLESNTSNNHEPQMKKLKKECDYEEMLKTYFQLDYKLQEYYPKWSESDPYFAEASKQFYGVRMLKQDLTENIFSFICSTNNNIARISSMVEKLARFFGEEICTYDNITYYTFPKVETLAKPGVEEKLKENGFGYRAKYIYQSARTIMVNGGEAWLEKLKGMNYQEAKLTLMSLTGIGPKVADCICLMSLGHLQAIPVDTHIYQIAQKFYLPNLAKQKTVTERVYNEIGEHFRQLYGPLAGWAHTVLFCADLKKFQNEEHPKRNRNRK